MRCIAHVVISGACLYGSAYAQFLRVGPFDFNGRARLEGVYSTNVENKRESESTAEREDYYVMLSLDMLGSGAISSTTTAEIDAGLALEKHFNRSDLDNSDRPFGRIEGRTRTELSRVTVLTYAGVERTSASADSLSDKKVFTPGVTSKTRREATETSYGASVGWNRDPFQLQYSYDMTQQRYDREEDQRGDQDEQEFSFDAAMKLRDNLSVKYANERTKTELVNATNAVAPWKTTETVDVDWSLQFWRHPKTTYRFGVEKEDTDTKKGSWDMRHQLMVEDKYEFSRTLRLSFAVIYSQEQQEEEDDIGLTYNAQLEHDLGRTARQSVKVTREAVGTFGTTTSTETTEWTYKFQKEDLFVYGLDFDASASHQSNKPVDPDVPDEVVITYDLTLANRVPISRRLTRTLMYDYSRSDSDLENEPVTEHRFTLRYEYEL